MKFKHDKDKKLFFKLHPALIMIYTDLYNYIYEKYNIGLTCTATISTPEEDKQLNRKSKAHLNRIAIDIRSEDLYESIIKDILEYLNNNWRFKKYQYLSLSGVSRLAYYHNNGNGKHIHIALHSKYALKPLFT